MLDVIGTVLVGAAMAVILAGLVTTVPLSPSGRLSLAGVLGAWVGLAGAVASSGGLSSPVTLLAMFGGPLLTTALLVLASPGARHALMAIPIPLLVGLNGIRLAGVLFMFLAAAGRLSGPFPYQAGLGDFITGALAIPAAWLVASQTRLRDRLIVAWNSFGMLDLVVAVTLGLISRNGSPVQLIYAGVGTAAMQTLPWAFVPTALVPFFLIAHAIIFAQIRARARAKAGRIPSAVDDMNLARQVG
jgi:hypothetical protein